MCPIWPNPPPNYVPTGTSRRLPAFLSFLPSPLPAHCPSHLPRGSLPPSSTSRIAAWKWGRGKMRILVFQSLLNFCCAYLYVGYWLHRKTRSPLDSCAMRRSSPIRFFFFLLFLWPIYVLHPFPFHIPQARYAAFWRMFSFVMPIILSTILAVIAYIFCIVKNVDKNIINIIVVFVLIFSCRTFLDLFRAK